MSAPGPEEYLSPDFDASSLTMPQLRSILLEHEVSHKATAKKGDLVSAFEEHVRPKATAIRTASSRVKASNKGITVMSDAGSDIASVGSGKGTRRRGKAATTEDVEMEGPSPEKVRTPVTKRGRGARRTASRSGTVETTDAEEDEGLIHPSAPRSVKKRRLTKAEMIKDSDDEMVDAATQMRERPPASPAARGRRKTTTPARTDEEKTPKATRTRRTGRSRDPATVDSASPAAGSSAPASSAKPPPPSSVSAISDAHRFTPTPAGAHGLTPRKSEPSIRIMEAVREEGQKKTGKSPMKAKAKSPISDGEESAFSDRNPFQSGSEGSAKKESRRRKSSLGPNAGVAKPKTPRMSEPAPRVTSITPPHGLRKTGPSRESLRSTPADYKKADDEIAAAEEYNHQVAAKLNRISSRDPPAPREELVRYVRTAGPRRITDPQRALPLGALLLLLFSLLGNWKSQSSAIGFCDPGSSTNQIVTAREWAISKANECIDHKARLDFAQPGAGATISCDTTALPLVPFMPRPTSCTPCPPHAVCANGEWVACEQEYVSAPHPLGVLSPALDGLPGVGPRAFPPRCRPDTAKMRMIGNLAREVEGHLARGRGAIVCAGLKSDARGEGERFGIPEDLLRERFSARRDPKYSQEQFDVIFESALKDLLDHQDIVESIDADGTSFYAATRTELTLGCRAKIEAINLLTAWKKQLGSSIAIIALIAWLRSTIAQHQKEKHTIEELVGVVLRRLQEQESQYYIDNVTTPTSFLQPDQLRDLVLPPSASTASKARLWRAVEAKVEKNANVQVSEREVRGELWKTWEWAGGALSPRVE